MTRKRYQMSRGRWQRFKDWLFPERAYRRQREEHERGRRLMRRMWELGGSQPRSWDLGTITREHGWQMPPETAEFLRRVCSGEEDEPGGDTR